MLRSRLRLLLCPLLALFWLFAEGCDEEKNPPSLWLSYAQSELNLVLIDHEPPPF